MSPLSWALLGLISVIALSQALPSSRVKRGFRINSVNRVAHGYGKRQFDDTWNAADDSALKTGEHREWLTVQQLSELAAGKPSLLEALIRKFIDSDDDGIITTQELLGQV